MLAEANRVGWYGHVLTKDEDDALRKEFQAGGSEKKTEDMEDASGKD